MRTMTDAEFYLRLLAHVTPHWRAFALGCPGMVPGTASRPLMALVKR
jgi:hypothetical protein